MKKYLRYFALLLTLCLFLTACGGGDTGHSEVETPDEPTQMETPDEPTTGTKDQEIPNNVQMLLSTAEPLMDMEATKRENYGNGSYYYMDVAGDNALRCINSCYQTTIR